MNLSKKSLRVLASLSIAATVSLTATVPNVLAVTQPEADTPLTKDKLQKLSVQWSITYFREERFDHSDSCCATGNIYKCPFLSI